MDLCRIAVNLVRGTLSSRIAARHNQETWQQTVRYLIATDRSLAENIREGLAQAINNAMGETYFDESSKSGFYDTKGTGKGFRPGYISFGLLPIVWRDGGITGGILISGNYDTSAKSTSPEPNTPEFKEWSTEGGNPDFDGREVPIDLWGGYFTKTAGGGLNKEEQAAHLGQAVVLFDANEEVIEIALQNPAKVKKEIDTIVDDILKRPPEEAVTKDKSRRKKLSPYSGLKKFLEHLNNTERDVFYQNEVNAISQWTGKTPREIKEQLQRAYKTFDAGKLPEEIPVKYLAPTPVRPAEEVADPN